MPTATDLGLRARPSLPAALVPVPRTGAHDSEPVGTEHPVLDRGSLADRVLAGPGRTVAEWEALADRALVATGRRMVDWDASTTAALERFPARYDWDAVAAGAVARIPAAQRTARRRQRWQRAGQVATGASCTVAVTAMLGLALLPRTGTYSTLTVLTGSMAPSIPVGAVVVVVPRPAAALAVGDVVSFRTPGGSGSVTTHRLVGSETAAEGLRLRTRGDANPAVDDWTLVVAPRDEVLTVRATLPVLGTVLEVLRSPLVRAGVLWVAPLLFLVSVLRRIWARP